MSADILATRIDWVAVARIASQKAQNGKKYSASYCRDVARGMRNSGPLEPILQELGVMQADQAVAA